MRRREEVSAHDVDEEARHEHECVFSEEGAEIEAELLMSIAVVVVSDQPADNKKVVDDQQRDERSVEFWAAVLVIDGQLRLGQVGCHAAYSLASRYEGVSRFRDRQERSRNDSRRRLAASEATTHTTSGLASA